MRTVNLRRPLRMSSNSKYVDTECSGVIQIVRTLLTWDTFLYAIPMLCLILLAYTTFEWLHICENTRNQSLRWIYRISTRLRSTNCIHHCTCLRKFFSNFRDFLKKIRFILKNISWKFKGKSRIFEKEFLKYRQCAWCPSCPLY